jgi:hypothetical protein
MVSGFEWWVGGREKRREDGGDASRRDALIGAKP